MNREQIVRNIKREMKRWIDQMDDQNYLETKDTLDKYYQVMESVTSLPAPPPVIQKKKKAPIVEEPTIEVVEKKVEKEVEQESHSVTKTEVGAVRGRTRKVLGEDAQKEYQEQAGDFFSESIAQNEPLIEAPQVKTPVGYPLERKLRGGVLQEIGAFVPEGIIRKLGLQHGDLVEAKPMLKTEGGRSKYIYTLVEARGEGDTTGRIQLDYCMVEKEAGFLVVKRSYITKEVIRFNDVPFSMLLSDGDVQTYGIKEGDIIDIAYKSDKPNENRVVWRHEIELPVAEDDKKERKRKEVDTKKEMSDELEQTLAGNDVLIIGNEANKAEYQEQIEKRGGNFLWADSSKRTDTYPSLVRKASFTIFLLGSSGHTGMKQIKQLCKEYDKPFEATFNQGITSIVRTAEELALAEEKEKESVLSSL